MSDKQLLTMPEFLTSYSISRTGAYREIASGRLRIIKIGRATRIARADAEAWLEALRAQEPKVA